MEGQCSRARVKIRWQGERRGSRNVSCPPKFAHARFFFLNNFFDNIIYLQLRALFSAFCSVVKITYRSLQVSHLSFFFNNLQVNTKQPILYVDSSQKNPCIFYLIFQFCNLPLSIDSSPCTCAWLLIFPSALTGTKSC